MDFIEKSQREIELNLSSMGYIFASEVKLGGERFIVNYINPEEKQRLQIVYELYTHNAFCKQVYEDVWEES